MKCCICRLWRIDRKATWLGLWDDGKLCPICDNCRAAGAGRANGYQPDRIDEHGRLVKA
jgi:hypothetical protein